MCLDQPVENRIRPHLARERNTTETPIACKSGHKAFWGFTTWTNLIQGTPKRENEAGMGALAAKRPVRGQRGYCSTRCVIARLERGEQLLTWCTITRLPPPMPLLLLPL